MVRCFKSDDYNWVFDTATGMFARWGKTVDEDPDWSSVGPEILDIEISYGSGCLGNCKHCYKMNNGSWRKNVNMTLDEFVNIFEKMKANLTQIAFGIMDIGTNPDFFPMMEYSRKNGVIPNYTCHGLDVTPDIAKRTAEICGAVAVSIVNKEKSFDAIKMFSDAGMKQVNIHYVLSEETIPSAFELIKSVSNDERTKDIGAIVFLQYKPMGMYPGIMTPVKDYKILGSLSEECRKNGIGCGFDSCSAPLFLKSLPRGSDIAKMVEPCESALFSSYVNADGEFFPCSFSEYTDGWKNGISVLECNNFLEDVWNNERTKDWRSCLIYSSKYCKCEWSSGCRSCPIYKISACKEE